MRTRDRLPAAAIALVVAACGGPASSSFGPADPAVSIPSTSSIPSVASSIPSTSSIPSVASSSPSVASSARAPVAAQLPAGTSCGVPAAYFAAGSTPQTIDPSMRQIQASRSMASGLPGFGAMALSPDGALIETAAVDGSKADIRLWDASGKPLARLSGAAPQVAGHLLVACLAWSADGATLASGSADGSVRLWDRSGRLVATLAGSDPIESLAWSARGVLATGAIHFPPASATGLQPLPGVVKLWRRDGKLLQTLGTDSTGGKFLNLRWSADGSMLAAGVSDYRVWKPDGSPVATIRPGGTPAWAMDWAPDGSAVAIGDENGLAEIVDVQGSMHGWQLGNGVDFLAYSPDGTRIAVSTTDLLRIFRATDPPLEMWSAHVADAQVRWAPDGSSMLVLGSGGLVVYSGDGRVLAALAGCEGRVTAFDRIGDVAIAVTDAGRICRWELTAG